MDLNKKEAPTMWVHELEEFAKEYLEHYEKGYDNFKPEVQKEIRFYKGVLNLLKISREIAIERDKLKSPEFQNNLFCAVTQGILSNSLIGSHTSSNQNAENIINQYNTIVTLKLKTAVTNASK